MKHVDLEEFSFLLLLLPTGSRRFPQFSPLLAQTLTVF